TVMALGVQDRYDCRSLVRRTGEYGRRKLVGSQHLKNFGFARCDKDMTTDDLDRVIDFIAERDPDFPAQIKGAASGELDRLERAMGRPLLPAHRRFLERMGRFASWLRLDVGRFDVDSLIRYYEYYGPRNPEGHVLIGRAEGESEYD